MRTENEPINDILVLVHPGSCCGSANSNIGRSAASEGREDLAYCLETWEGGIVVIDSDLSDELAYYKKLDQAIREALDKAAGRTDVSVRIMGGDEDDFNQVAAIDKVVADLGLVPAERTMHLTGAWYDPEGDEGCVNSVRDRLVELGFRCEVLDSAVSLDDSHSPSY